MCRAVLTVHVGPDEESSSATTVGPFQGSVTLCRVEEEGRIASRRQTAIDARMASVRGALVLRIEESSVLIPESVLTAAQLFASILNTVGSACYWAGLCTPGSALLNVGCSIACVVTAADLARVSHMIISSRSSPWTPSMRRAHSQACASKSRFGRIRRIPCLRFACSSWLHCAMTSES